jgi:hypothetical protein
MQSSEWAELIKRVPEQQREILTFMTRAGTEIALQSVLRVDEHYVVARGRLSGTTDQDRTFFIPYDQIVYLGFTRPVPSSMLARMYGDETVAKAVAAAPIQTPAAQPELPPSATTPAQPASEPVVPESRPKSESKIRISKATLLERIRAHTSGKVDRVEQS